MDYKNLKNARNLRAFMKDASSKDISDIISKLTVIYEEKKEAELSFAQEQKTRREFLEKVLSTLDTHNFTIEELQAIKELKLKKPRKSIEIKYRYTDLDGIERTWSGQGKLPLTFKALLQSNGLDKSAYLINSNSKQDNN